MAATSEATKEYMVNPISVGIRLIGMKLGEDADLEASYKINYCHFKICYFPKFLLTVS